MKKKNDPTILEAFFSLSFFSFSSVVTRALPSSIKGEAGHPMKGDPDRHKIEQRDKSARAVIELSAPIHSFHQRLGILFLSCLFVTPTTNQVPITRAAANYS